MNHRLLLATLALLPIIACSSPPAPPAQTGVAADQPPAVQGLSLSQNRPERVTGWFVKDERAIRFDAFANSAAGQVSLYDAHGRELFFLAASGAEIESHRLLGVETKDVSGKTPDELTLSPDDERHVGAVLTDPDLALLPWLAMALGQAGATGKARPPTLPLHKLAVKVASTRGIKLPAEAMRPTAAAGEIGYCADLREDPYDNGCVGMCGKGCKCWWNICGDCCWNKGCAIHDDWCGQCDIFHPHDCFLCWSPAAAEALFNCGGGKNLIPDDCADPGPGQVSLYADANYQGKCQMLGIGEYVNSTTLGIGNDSLSSMRIGPGVAALLCEDSGYRGSCKWLASPTFDANGQSTPLNIPHVSSHWKNDGLTSLKVQWLGDQLGSTKRCHVPGRGEIAIYEDANFTGHCATLPAGGYPNSSVIGIRNDKASSAVLGPDTFAYLCEDSNYGGCTYFTSDEGDLYRMRSLGKFWKQDALTSTSVGALE